MTNPSDLRRLVYEENVRAPTWLYLVLGLFLGGAAGLLSAFAIRAVMGEPIVEGSQAFATYFALTVYLLVDLFLLVNFTNLAVSVSAAGVEMRFGLFAKLLPSGTLERAEPQKYNWTTYGGWGLRLAFGGRRAWSMLGVPRGVLVRAAGTSYFISSRSPEALADAINSTRSLDS